MSSATACATTATASACGGCSIVFACHGIKATVSLNFGVIEHYPEVWQALRERGDDILCHGFYNTRYLWGLPEEDERAVIRDCVETYARATGGEMLPGWFGPAVSGTFNTADIVKELGIKYTADYYHDEQPTLVRTKHGALPCVPYSMDINRRAGLSLAERRRGLRAHDPRRLRHTLRGGRGRPGGCSRSASILISTASPTG